MLKFLYFSSCEWSELWRRKQHIAAALSEHPEVGGVLHVNPPVETSWVDLIRGRMPVSHLGDSRRKHLDALLARPRQVAPGVWTYTGSTKTVPLSRFDLIRRQPWLRQLNQSAFVRQLRHSLAAVPGDDLILWLTNPLHAFLIDAFPRRRLLVYDWTDDWSEFECLQASSRSELDQLNERVIREANVVLAVSSSLCKRAIALNPNTFHVPNATDPSILQRPSPLAPEIATIPSPRLGYVGQIGDRVDFELLDNIARSHPNWHITLVGPVWSNRREAARDLSKRRNVHFLGEMPYNRLNELLPAFDVCMIPHTVDSLTKSMDPIKLYDYFTTGKPIVTTQVAGVERFPDAVYVANSAGDFTEQIGLALREVDQSLRRRRLEYASENSWKARTEEVWRIVSAAAVGGDAIIEKGSGLCTRSCQ